jgi:hypothetical protein
MSTEFNELLSLSPDEKPQLWIIGTREQVLHWMNELMVKGVVRGAKQFPLRGKRVHFSPIIPAPFAVGKFMVVLIR